MKLLVCAQFITFTWKWLLMCINVSQVGLYVVINTIFVY